MSGHFEIMKLTTLQLRSLKLLLRQKSKPLNAMDFVKEAWQKYALILAVVGGAIGVSIVNGWVAVSLLLAGYLVGIMERDFQWLKNQIRVLPLTSEITKWERVEELIRENEPPEA
jgi:hypothetical protein